MTAKLEPRHVSATEARVHFGELLQAIDRDGETVIVERGGRELAALVPISQFRRLTRSRLPDEFWQESQRAFDELNRNLDGQPMPSIRELIDAGRD